MGIVFQCRGLLRQKGSTFLFLIPIIHGICVFQAVANIQDQKLENGAVFSHRLSKHYSAVDYANSGPLNYTVNLLACDDDIAPEYADNPTCPSPPLHAPFPPHLPLFTRKFELLVELIIVQSLCTLTVDL